MILSDLVGLINFGYLNTNAMNHVLKLRITPKVLLTRPFMWFMALLCVLYTCLRTGLSIPNAKINKIWYVNQVNLDNTVNCLTNQCKCGIHMNFQKCFYHIRSIVPTCIWSQLSLQAAWHWIWREGRALYLYMISAESPGSMTLGSGVKVLYCIFIWSKLSLQAVWHLDLVWRSCTVPLYDLSWFSRQHDIWILCGGPVLYLYMISAESPGSMAFGSGVRVLYCTCIWYQLSL